MNGWQPGDYDQIVMALMEAFLDRIAAGAVWVTRESKRRSTSVRGASVTGWELTIREKRTGNVEAHIIPNKPVIVEADLTALRVAAANAKLVNALRSSGGWWDGKLAERLSKTDVSQQAMELAS